MVLLEDRASSRELKPQRLEGAARRHAHAVPRALAFADQERAPLEVDVLDAQAQALEESQAYPVKEGATRRCAPSRSAITAFA